MIEYPLPANLQFRKLLGKGGTAAVVEATDSSARRVVAAKIADPDNNDNSFDLSALLARENALIGGHRYPGLVRLYQLYDNPLCLTMDLCPGQSIDQLPMPIDPKVLPNLISALAVSMTYLKLAGIVHGDIKPHNFYLPNDIAAIKNDTLFYTKLSDFSLGRKINEAEEARAGLGTLGYCAPETHDDGPTSHASDIFSFGVMLYQLLTGVHPFADGESDPVLIASRVREEVPTALVDYGMNLSAEVLALIDTMLAKRADQRPKSCWELVTLLSKHGATYPYQRALSPRHLVLTDRSYEENLSHLNLSDEKERARLLDLTGGDNNALSIVLHENFIRNNLSFDGSSFASNSEIIWPARLRRNLVSMFCRRAISDKKALIKEAVVGNAKVDHSIEAILDDRRDPCRSEAFGQLLCQCLSPRTIKRISRREADRMEAAKVHLGAATLYIQAGDFRLAEENALLAASTLRGDHKFSEAVAILNKVIRFGHEQSQTVDTTQLLMLKADILKDSGDTNTAEQTYAEILELYKERQPDSLLGETYKDLGDLYRLTQNFTKGLESLHKALDIYTEIDNQLEIARTRNNIGNIHTITGQTIEAVRSYHTAFQIQKRLDAKPEMASTLNNIGASFGLKGMYRRALKYFHRSLDLNREIGIKVEIARSLHNLGFTYFYCDQYDEAVSLLEESLAMHNETGARKSVLFNLENITQILMTSGRLKDALKYLSDGMALARELNDRPHQAIFNLATAGSLIRMGRFNEAQKTLDEVSNAMDQFEDLTHRRDLIIEQARLRLAIGDADEAARHARRALVEAEGEKNLGAELKALDILIRCTDSDAFYHKSLEIAKKQNLQREALIATMNRAGRLMGNKEIDRASPLIEESLEQLEAIKSHTDLSRMLNIAAEYMLKIGKSVKAKEYMECSATMARQGGQQLDLARTHLLAGKIAYMSKEYQECFGFYREALNIHKAIVAQIEDAHDRMIYQRQPSIGFLVTQIKELSNVMTKK